MSKVKNPSKEQVIRDAKEHGWTMAQVNDVYEKEGYELLTRESVVGTPAEFLNRVKSMRQGYVVDPDDLGPGWLETELGQTAGGVAGGIAGFNYGLGVAPAAGPFAPVVPFVTGVGGAFIGGMIGEGTQQAYQTLTDNPYAPENLSESFDRILEAGGEEALYDAVGQLFFRAGAQIFKFLKPKPSEGIQVIKETIEAHGGKLSASQVVDNKIIDTIEGLAEASWGGSPLNTLRTMNDEAIERYVNDYLSHLAGVAQKELNDEGLGQLFIALVRTGKDHKKIITDRLYSELDRLYIPFTKTRKVVETNPTGIVDASGNMLNRKTVQIIEEEVLPVSTKGLKENALKLLEPHKASKRSALGSKAKTMLQSVERFNSRMTFNEMQTYLSSLKSMERDLKNAASPDTELQRILNNLIGAGEEAMEMGAKSTDNKEFHLKWLGAKAFVKESSEALSNKQINKMVHMNPEKIGEYLFRSGNVTEIKEVRRALAKAAQLSKGKDDAFLFTTEWRKMQAGYLRSILADATDLSKSKLSGTEMAERALKGEVSDITSGELSIVNLKKLFLTGTKQQRTFAEAFTKSQREGIKHFIKVVEVAQKRPEGAGTFMVTVGQAGLLLNLVSKTIDVGTLGLYTVFANGVSRALTNPKIVKLLSEGVKLRPGTPRYGAVAAQLMAYFTGVDALGDNMPTPNQQETLEALNQ